MHSSAGGSPPFFPAAHALQKSPMIVLYYNERKVLACLRFLTESHLASRAVGAYTCTDSCNAFLGRINDNGTPCETRAVNSNSTNVSVNAVEVNLPRTSILGVRAVN